MVGQINHLANCLNEAVTDTYFFLKKSYMANTTHTMPMPAKNKPTKLAHHASAAMLSIQFGQLQAQAVHCMCNQCSCSICFACRHDAGIPQCLHIGQHL